MSIFRKNKEADAAAKKREQQRLNRRPPRERQSQPNAANPKDLEAQREAEAQRRHEEMKRRQLAVVEASFENEDPEAASRFLLEQTQRQYGQLYDQYTKLVAQSEHIAAEIEDKAMTLFGLNALIQHLTSKGAEVIEAEPSEDHDPEPEETPKRKRGRPPKNRAQSQEKAQ